MTSEVQNILHTFDSLPDADKRVLASEILRRSVTLDQEPLADEQLLEAADELFQELDRQEEAKPREGNGHKRMPLFSRVPKLHQCRRTLALFSAYQPG